MNEADTRADLIDPALKAAGWGVVEGSRVRREVIAPGRIEGGGKRAKAEIADYVLIHRNTKLAVIEAKKRSAPVTEGLAQAKQYAGKLLTRFAFATNGNGIYQVDMQTGAEGPIDAFPSPESLWAATFAEPNSWRDRFAAVPFEDRSGFWQARYYQDNAVARVLDAIAKGKTRALLTLATGTGKTSIAFQIAWKLFHSKWNLSGEPTRRPRVLFLADRNILADQAYNAFAAFPEDALVRIRPDEIARKGRVPTNGSVFFTIFQTFMSGKDAEGNDAPNFGDYPPDFFDCIIVDECHRGGAKDESTWRAILEYFAPAFQLGLTATPKRQTNADTYAYFGEPVYIYSLKDGINDGYLTPFKVKQIATTLDDYIYTPDDEVLSGEIDPRKRYREGEFNRVIEITERERYRVQTFMGMIDQREKTIVFCASQDHAAAVRDLINQMKTSTDPLYCARVTANDGALGEQHLKAFQNNEKTIPTILTTSQKLSTGVDARNVRNIVLMRPVNSMIEFKQIIGRGTRLYDGKEYFTILDFVKAYEHFNDPEWDGEPLQPEPPRPPRGQDDEPPTEPPPNDADTDTVERIKIKLADGKERTIQHMSATTFWSPDGRPISAAQFVEKLFGDLPAFFRDEEELRHIWSLPETRKALLQGLADKGYGRDQLMEIRRAVNAEKSDVFDVLAYVAFLAVPITRLERVETHRDRALQAYGAELQAFLSFVLAQYVTEGVDELDQEKLGTLITLQYGSVNDAIRRVGDVSTIRNAFVGFQKHLFQS
ncbi:MAG: EcoAI/FtnUII family type I restriction enzme subunit R [Beijerinckiaceae bacterium]